MLSVYLFIFTFVNGGPRLVTSRVTRKAHSEAWKHTADVSKTSRRDNKPMGPLKDVNNLNGALPGDGKEGGKGGRGGPEGL